MLKPGRYPHCEISIGEEGQIIEIHSGAAVPPSRKITIGGITFDLSADRSFPASASLIGIHTPSIPLGVVSWIDALYFSADGSAFSYNESSVEGFTPISGLKLGGLFSGLTVSAKLTSVQATLAASVGTELTLTARKRGGPNYAAQVTIPAGQTQATWVGDLAVADLIWLTTTLGLVTTNLSIGTTFIVGAS